MEKAKKEKMEQEKKEQAKLQKSDNTPKKPRGRPRKSQMKSKIEKELNTESCAEGENTYINTTDEFFSEWRLVTSLILELQSSNFSLFSKI